MSLLKDLAELENAGIITSDTAWQIANYYQKKKITTPNRQLLIFGFIGALLVGIGLMFIVANQWDDMPRSVQTLCAFLLLIIPQALCGYVYLKKPDKIVWRESTALILFFAVGASISLISQIYHINGEVSGFTLVWALLTVPLIYLLDSSSISLAYLCCIMVFGLSVKNNGIFPFEEYLFWLLLVIPIPHYHAMIRKSPDNILVIIHHWIIPFVLVNTLGILSGDMKMLMYSSYISMFCIFYFAGNTGNLKNRPLIQNGYKIFGFLGTIIVLLVLTFKTSWSELAKENYSIAQLMGAPEFYAALILFILASMLLYGQNKSKPIKNWELMDVMYILFILIFILAIQNISIAIVTTDLTIFILGVLMLREGSRLSHLGVLNIGMLVIALLVICRSFDTDLTFVVKGTLFVLVGIGFFAANWLMIKKRNENEA